jgi:hypothetical protein
MNCERCLRAEEARYRAYSDIIDMKVCGACAADGWQLGLTIEVLDPLHSPLPQLARPQRLSYLVG